MCRGVNLIFFSFSDSSLTVINLGDVRIRGRQGRNRFSKSSRGPFERVSRGFVIFAVLRSRDRFFSDVGTSLRHRRVTRAGL